MKQYHVYALIKGTYPIYVGCSCSLSTRLSKHKKTKDFDYHLIIKSYDNKKDALVAENAIIRYLSYFANDENINGKFSVLQYEKAFRDGRLG